MEFQYIGKNIYYIIVSGLLLSLNNSYADNSNDIQFVKITDTNTPILNRMGNYISVSSPSISQGNVVFIGHMSIKNVGVYAYINGRLQCVANIGDEVPGGGVFENFLSPI